MRIHAVAQRRPRGMNPLDQVAAPRHHAADQVRVSGEVLRPRMHDQVNPELRRTLVDWSTKRGQSSNLFQIDHPQGRVGWRFQIKQLGVRLDGARVLLVLRGIDERGLNPHFGQPLRKEFRCAAVNVTLRDDVIA